MQNTGAQLPWIVTWSNTILCTLLHRLCAPRAEMGNVFVGVGRGVFDWMGWNIPIFNCRLSMDVPKNCCLRSSDVLEME
jgi:hypothetical protein